MPDYFVLAEESQGGVVAVGPFKDDDAASDWAHQAEYVEYLTTARGVVRRVSPTRFIREARRNREA